MFLTQPRGVPVNTSCNIWSNILSDSICLSSKFHLNNPTSGSWVRSKVEVTQSKHHVVDSYPYHFKSNRQSDPEIQPSWNLNLNRSQSGSSALSTHIPFVACQMALKFLRYCYFEFWPWKSKVKIIAQGHIVGPTPYRLIPFVPCQSTIPFPRWHYFVTWPCKFKVKVMSGI